MRNFFVALVILIGSAQAFVDSVYLYDAQDSLPAYFSAPQYLSGTGMYTNLAAKEISPELIPYNEPVEKPNSTKNSMYSH